MKMKISQSAHSVHAVTATVDVPELAIRYEVVLTFDPVRKVYGIEGGLSGELGKSHHVIHMM